MLTHLRRQARPCLSLTALLLASFATLAQAADSYPASLPAKASFRDCADCPELVVVAPGKFTMGFDGGEDDRPEGPTRAVTIRRAFALARLEVTQLQYAAFVADTSHDSGAGCHGPLRSGESGNWSWYSDANWQQLPAAAPAPRATDPVVCISWRDAQAYVAWLSLRTGQRYRLPTEAEWEYAARAGATTQFPWGDGEAGACAQANVYDQSGRDPSRRTPFAPCDDGQPRVAPAGSLAPNAWGLQDMIGNVWEWTQDCYVAPYPRRPVNGAAVEVRGECALRAVRGGSWRTSMFRQRSSWRGRDPEDRKSDIFGFRVARDLR
jgi:formylglycine-generating enzyme required for sulfatase activity